MVDHGSLWPIRVNFVRFCIIPHSSSLVLSLLCLIHSMLGAAAPINDSSKLKIGQPTIFHRINAPGKEVENKHLTMSDFNETDCVKS